MPIRIFSKALAEKHDEFISRMYQGLEIEGSTAIDYQVRPPQNKFQVGSYTIRWINPTQYGNMEVNTVMNVNEGGDTIVLPNSFGTMDDGSNITVALVNGARSTNAFGTYNWNEEEGRYEKTGYSNPEVNYIRIITDDAGSSFTFVSDKGTFDVSVA